MGDCDSLGDDLWCDGGGLGAPTDISDPAGLAGGGGGLVHNMISLFCLSLSLPGNQFENTKINSRI